MEVLPGDFWEVPLKAFLPPFARWNVKRWLGFRQSSWTVRRNAMLRWQNSRIKRVPDTTMHR